MKSSTRDKIEGKTRQATGAAKEKVGQMTNNPKLADKGTAEKVAGKIQDKAGDVKKVFGK